jgi:probable rRNA maturation factor
MTYEIEVQSEVVVPEQVIDLLKSAVISTLQQEAVPTAALTVLLTDDRHMKQLNHDYRGLNSSTDVLSFPAGNARVDFSEQTPYLGDVAISVPTANKQSQSSGHPLAAELQLLTVHGVLHLLGFDHLSTEDKARMWSRQNEILLSLGLENIVPTET